MLAISTGLSTSHLKQETTMDNRSFTTAFTVDQSPEEAFAAITNVRGWWSEDINGRTEKVGDIFNYRFRDIHRCTTEWKGTDVIFDIAKKDDKTEIRVTHDGLVPEYECYDICSNGWTTYINGSLQALITTGKGQPNVGEPRNESERALAL
jgi:hypothetical protein